MLNKKTFIIVSTIAIIAFGIIGAHVYRWEYRKPFFEVYFFSLNKGRSIFVRSPKGKTFLIGGGQNSEVIREITKVMPFYKRKIDYIVVPSAVPAQIGGLIEVVDRYDIGEVIVPKIMATSSVLAQLMKNVYKKKIHVEEVERGDVVEIEENFSINIFFPYKEFRFNKTSLPELGFLVSFASTSVYFIGNLSRAVQKNILNGFDSDFGGSKSSNGQRGLIDLSVNIAKGDQNLVEFYNTASVAKVSDELLKILKPKFIFSTREKAAYFVSDGEEWVRK